MKRLLILGAGGHGKIVLDLALSTDTWDEIKFLDTGKVGEEVLGYKVIGPIEACKDLRSAYTHAIVAIGNNTRRLQLTHELMELGYEVPTLIHPTAVVSAFAKIGKGTIVMPNVTINVDAQVGEAVIVNTGVIIEHECKIGDGVHLSPAATLGGAVAIGANTWIGLGAKVIQGIHIGPQVMVGAGAVIIRSVEAGVTVVGVPAKEIGGE